MLQNISKNYEQREEVKEKAEVDYKEVASRIFSGRNIIIYVLTLMISMVGFGFDNDAVIAPFGLALVTASISLGLPIAVVYVVSLIGTAIGFGGGTTLTYIFTSLTLLFMVLIKKPIAREEENEKIRLGGYLFVSIMLVQIVQMIFKGFYMYYLLLAVAVSVTSYIFYKIFVNSLDVIAKYGEKTVFSIEEVVGASLLFAIATISLSNINIFSFSIRNIICIFIVLFLGWRNGIIMGGISGITIGIVLGIIGTGDPTLIATYAISGMIAGLLNRFGKWGVIIGFALGNVLIAYSANGGTSNIIMFQEIVIASLGLLAVPKMAKINIEELVPQVKMLPEAGKRLEGNEETLIKLDSISKTISEIANNYKQDELYEKNETLFEEEVVKALEGMENNMLYDDLYENVDGILTDIFDILVENGVITENGVIAVFAAHNTYLMTSNNSEIREGEEEDIREALRALNSAYRVCKVNIVWQKKLNEKEHNMSEQLKNVSSAIEDITEKMKSSESNDEFEKEKGQIINTLREKNVILKDINIKKQESGRFVVNAYTDICKDEAGKLCPIKQISRSLAKVLNDRFTVQDQECGIRLNKDVCTYTYLSDDRYVLQTGIAKAKKDGSIVSGDMTSSIRLGDGKYLFAISDGMGSGAEAMKNSKIAISMLERLLSSGFEKDTSINLINSAILTANNDDNYATLDVSILDLYSGKVEFLKNGACPTYIKKNRNVSIVESTSLPTGIMSNISIDTYDKDLEDGDIIVMCSDGIIDSNAEYANRDLWLKYLLEDIQTDSPEKIADIILREAIDNNVGKAKDDMSVIALKVLKKM